MHREFEDRFGSAATCAVRSPGRVNLIGEHTDHQLLPVMPLAIDRSIRFVAGPSDDGFVRAVSRTHPGTVEFSTSEFSTAMPDAGEGWGSYFRGAVAAIASEHDIAGRGARLLLDADLPDTGGLSSSAALVVGALRTLSDVWELDIAPERLPELALRAEHALGLENGGMDQTVVAVATAGHALWIGFDPLHWRHVPIPDGLEIIAASSGQTAHKGAGANVAYNSIVASCRAATLVLARRLGIEVDGPVVLRVVADHPDVEAAVAELPVSSTPADVARDLGIATDRIVQLTAKRLPDDLPIDLRNRAAHVLSETRRVAEAEAAMSSGDVETLGRLLDLSHESLQRFGVSSAALDHLTAAMRSAGALGARVTGAGFGGFTVAVTRPERTAAVLDAALTATGGPAFRVTASDGVGPWHE